MATSKAVHMTGSKVLVVDDEPTVREVVVGYLRRDGHEVAEAGDGYTALELLDSDPPDLVVKKMVFLYLTSYAKQNPELAILCINTLITDCRNVPVTLNL